jgi:hypothetical protein
VPDGAIWAIVLKKEFAARRSLDFGWADVQAAALAEGLVDNKVASVSSGEYATRFVVRHELRATLPGG